MKEPKPSPQPYSSSVSLDICSVSLHIYVNLIYLHFIVIYGLLCDFINVLYRGNVTLNICVSSSLCSLISHVAFVPVRSSSATSRHTPGGCFPLHTIHYPSSSPTHLRALLAVPALPQFAWLHL